MRTLLAFSLILLLKYSGADEVCCRDIGCFTDAPPYSGQPLPWCMDQINPSYTLYTRSNPNYGLTFTHNSAVPSSYVGSKRTVFVTHGWQGNGDNAWLHDMKDAFLAREDINVVVLGWEGGSDILNYPQAVANTRTTGSYTALVVLNLVNNNGGSDTRQWCVGHSLGSHVCGHTGMKTQLQRVTGMDPAGPGFEGEENLMVGLNPSSARFVDVIHTDKTYGTERTLGHIDFYPNGGDNQPSCGGVVDVAGCSHGRAVDYMIESLGNDCFLSHSRCTDYNNLPCISALHASISTALEREPTEEGSCSSCTCDGGACAILGYGADYGCQKDGIHYIEVENNPPYCAR